jgi:hypothetical protein
LAATWLLVGLLGYALARPLWPIRRQLLIQSGLAAASLLLTLCLVETVTRFIPFRLLGPSWPRGYYVPLLDGQGYRVARNYPPTVMTNEQGDRTLVVSNSLGVRDVELRPGAAAQTIILVLGDSMAFGVTGDVDGSWPRLLDNRLAWLKPGADIYHVVNAGLAGYNTFQEARLFEELVEEMERRGLKPQIALMSFFTDSWGRNLYGPEGRFTMMQDVVMNSSLKRLLLVLPEYLLARSQLDDLKLLDPTGLNRWHQALLAKSRLYFISCLLLTRRFDIDWDARPEVDPIAINTEALKSFEAVARAHGIRPLVAYLPGHYEFEAGQEAETQAEVAAVCQSLDLPFINPYDSMRQLGVNKDNARETLTLVHDSHYSVAGNRLYAQALAPLLLDYLSRLQLAAPVSTEPGGLEAKP